VDAISQRTAASLAFPALADKAESRLAKQLVKASDVSDDPEADWRPLVC